MTEKRYTCGSWRGNADFAALNPHFSNVLSAIITAFILGNSASLICRLDACLELLIRTGRLPEAAFLARTYLPSQVSRYRLFILGGNISDKNFRVLTSLPLVPYL